MRCIRLRVLPFVLACPFMGIAQRSSQQPWTWTQVIGLQLLVDYHSENFLSPDVEFFTPTHKLTATSWNPMMINTSGTCAATRLVQCRSMGISINDISRKFQKPPEAATDLSRDDFLARKAILGQVSQWCDDNREKKEMVNEWTPILYLYEVCHCPVVFIFDSTFADAPRRRS